MTNEQKFEVNLLDAIQDIEEANREFNKAFDCLVKMDYEGAAMAAMFCQSYSPWIEQRMAARYMQLIGVNQDEKERRKFLIDNYIAK